MLEPRQNPRMERCEEPAAWIQPVGTEPVWTGGQAPGLGQIGQRTSNGCSYWACRLSETFVRNGATPQASDAGHVCPPSVISGAAGSRSFGIVWFAHCIPRQTARLSTAHSRLPARAGCDAPAWDSLLLHPPVHEKPEFGIFATLATFASDKCA